MNAREKTNWHFYTAAELLEQELGDPSVPTGVFSFRQAVEQDEHEAFPEAACNLLNEKGFQNYYVPAQYGGNLRRFDEVFMLLRIIARRDLSVAIAHSKTFLGSAPIWIGGTTEQRMDLARRIQNGEAIALSLTEEAHGSDLMASECVSRKIHNRYLVTGTKWLVNNATRSTVLSLLCRTRPGGGPLGASLFYVKKEQLDANAFCHLPKIKTHGIRGIDISGIQFSNAVLQEEALIGKEHHGLEYLLKTFQITRPLCSALSLGAADTALRLALTFACQRNLYGKTILALPIVREELNKSFCDVIICECMALFAARALQALPGQMSVWSSVTKYFVPTLLEEMVRNTATVLGARYYLREHYAYGMFQKIVRDIAIVSLFDGNAHLNLSLIAGQLGQLVQYAEDEHPHTEHALLERLEDTCSLERTPPDFDTNGLVLSNRGHDDLQSGLVLAANCLDAQLEGRDVPRRVAEDLGIFLRRFAQERQRLDLMVGDLASKKVEVRSAVEGFALSKTYCILHAASACYHLWLFNTSLLDEPFVSGEWLVLCLNRLFKMLFPQEELIAHAAYDENLSDLLVQLWQENRLFGIFPVQLAMPSAAPAGDDAKQAMTQLI